jgi:hypothetical protein
MNEEALAHWGLLLQKERKKEQHTDNLEVCHPSCAVSMI